MKVWLQVLKHCSQPLEELSQVPIFLKTHAYQVSSRVPGEDSLPLIVYLSKS
jgi:hypothetical protein